ncbi:hypothetical protein K1X76_11370 [bacterium]|nr:hypothetical protein [bacterium]
MSLIKAYEAFSKAYASSKSLEDNWIQDVDVSGTRNNTPLENRALQALMDSVLSDDKASDDFAVWKDKFPAVQFRSGFWEDKLTSLDGAWTRWAVGFLQNNEINEDNKANAQLIVEKLDSLDYEYNAGILPKAYALYKSDDAALRQLSYQILSHLNDNELAKQKGILFVGLLKDGMEAEASSYGISSQDQVDVLVSIANATFPKKFDTDNIASVQDDAATVGDALSKLLALAQADATRPFVDVAQDKLLTLAHQTSDVSHKKGSLQILKEIITADEIEGLLDTLVAMRFDDPQNGQTIFLIEKIFEKTNCEPAVIITKYLSHWSTDTRRSIVSYAQDKPVAMPPVKAKLAEEFEAVVRTGGTTGLSTIVGLMNTLDAAWYTATFENRYKDLTKPKPAEEAENKKLLGALNDPNNQLSSGLDASLSSGIGGLIGSRGTQMGSGGLGGVVEVWVVVVQNRVLADWDQEAVALGGAVRELELESLAKEALWGLAVRGVPPLLPVKLLQ